MGRDATSDADDDLLSYGSPRRKLSVSSAAQRPVTTAQSAEDLLAFYRRRCEQFQSERQILVDHISNVEVTKEEYHRIKWDLKMRKEEIAELEASLKKANAVIFQLKEEKLALETENEALRIQEQGDRHKIQHLLALTQPVVEEVTFFRDCRPGTTAAFPSQEAPRVYSYPSTVHLGSEPLLRGPHRPSHRDGTESAGHAASAEKPQRRRPQVLRTIYMPNQQAEVLTKTIENLQRQLQRSQEIAEERMQHTLETFADEKNRLVEAQRAMEDKYDIMEKQLEKTKRLLHMTTKDYLVLRHQSQEAERQAHEEVYALQAKCRELMKESAVATSQALQDADAIKEKAQEESAQCAQQLRDQALARERDLLILREQYAAVQEACSRRIQDLETRLSNLRSRYRALDKRRAMEMEGFTRDIANLKRQTQRLEATLYGRRVYHLRRYGVVHEGSRSREPAARDSNQLSDEISALEQRIAALAADVDEDSSLEVTA
ncbi:hypothetical protein P43SY_006486 [Pythium insidiosum]|uniref:Coiled-coil domain-containing protein 77 n=1 Tax=Pythium insidiosum TaxID=114742 RepID=A0AAD5LGZ8_PYTIN|nr:hypothetical protein P43SY_006486 [Pythium insidiosum]